MTDTADAATVTCRCCGERCPATAVARLSCRPETPDVAAEFDREWEIVLDEAKQDRDLAPVHDLLAKWRHFA